MTKIKASVQPQLTCAPRLGASSPRAFGFPGITAPAAASGNGRGIALTSPVVVHAVPRDRHEAALAAKPMQPATVPAPLGQTNIHNYMTRAYATGKGASGPPPEPHERKPV